MEDSGKDKVRKWIYLLGYDLNIYIKKNEKIKIKK